METTRLAIIGRSGTGKDTVANAIMELMGTNNCAIMKMYTTRQKRNDQDVNYDFIDEASFKDLVNSGEIVEQRTYQILENGKLHDVYYGYGKSHLMAEKKVLLMPSATFECVRNIHENPVSQNIPITQLYIYTPRKETLLRSIDRESQHENPNYAEVCNRFILDEDQFGAIDKFLEDQSSQNKANPLVEMFDDGNTLVLGNEHQPKVFYEFNCSGPDRRLPDGIFNVFNNSDQSLMKSVLAYNLEKLRDPRYSVVG